jgi:hypothetical protein
MRLRTTRSRSTLGPRGSARQRCIEPAKHRIRPAVVLDKAYYLSCPTAVIRQTRTRCIQFRRLPGGASVGRKERVAVGRRRAATSPAEAQGYPKGSEPCGSF